MLFIVGCSQRPTPYFAPPRVVDNVYNHIVSIAVYYYMSLEEWERRQLGDHQAPRIPLDDEATIEKDAMRTIAYIGSGVILKDNHILTVRHLFTATDNTYGRTIWVFIQGWDHAIESELIAITPDDDYYNDYAVIKMKENANLPGLPIATKDAVLGEKVMFGCSVGGTAFFLRFGHVSHFKWYFRKDADGRLHLSKWRECHFTTTTPSGPGDSGSAVTNINGEIVGIIYIGTDIYGQLYSFSNPIKMLWAFLKEHQLEYLGFASLE
jgi:S1-C subfamily serine protease